MPSQTEDVIKEEVPGEKENGEASEPPRRVPVLPSLITLGNTVCGFGSICLAARAGSDETSRFVWLTWSAWLILLAMVFDALDGRVARLTRQTSDFGGHLDSLSDAISFGLAPGFLAWQVIKESSDFPFDWIERVVWLICALYVVCAVLRLARFNTSNQHDESAHRYFVGLPSPPAAGIVASLIILFGQLSDSVVWTKLIGSYILPVTVLFIGPLMMSKLRYVHLMHELFKNRRSFPFFIWLILTLFLVVAFLKLMLPILFGMYVLSGVVGLAIDKVLDRLDISQGRASSFFK